jgi:hypothetical protein
MELFYDESYWQGFNLAHEQDMTTMMMKIIIVIITIITIWSWVLEKSPIVQLLKNYPTFYEPERFITVFTTAVHWSYSEPHQFTSSLHPVPLRFILILYYHRSLGLHSCLFPFGSSTKIPYAFFFSPSVIHDHLLLDFIVLTIFAFREEYELWSSWLCTVL